MWALRSVAATRLGRHPVAARSGALLQACVGINLRCLTTAQHKANTLVASKDAIPEVEWKDLQALNEEAMQKISQAFVGQKACGAIAVVGIPNYREMKMAAYRQGMNLALLDSQGREKAAAVSNTYPGWSGTPGSETHPLQSSFLFNVKEEVPGGKPDPYFGKNIFPSADFKNAFVSLATPMHDAALKVLRGCDVLLEDISRQANVPWSASGRSLHELAAKGPALAGRFICYDSGFTREDKMLEQPTSGEMQAQVLPEQKEVTLKSAGHAGDGLASMRTHTTPVKSAGHAGDGLASMRTHTTPVKSAGHAGDGLASMRTHSTPVKSAGHAGDGLASMRTHSTPVKSAGHAGDGLASMRTHSTPVKSAGHAGDGLASMRTHSTPVKSAGHAGDGLASMRTHSTPVKSAGHAGDGLASMRTHSTPVKSAGHAGDGLASMRTHSTPVKSAGHAGDGLASMRTHSTPVKSAGHAGDGLASMRTHSTPVKSAGHAGDGLASMRTHSTPVKSAGHAGDGLASMRTHSTPVKSAGTSSFFAGTSPSGNFGPEASAARAIATHAQVEHNFEPAIMIEEEDVLARPTEDSAEQAGEYWLPWHIDSNFVTVLHREAYAHEHDGSLAPEPEGAGLLVMDNSGAVAKADASDEAMILQMGAFAQIYSGGYLTACRHAVLSPRPPGIARFNFCNFWYVPWDTLCDLPAGRSVNEAVNQGWNAMMDESYVDVTMKQSFAAFRKFMTAPEARLQFQESQRMLELSEILPALPSPTTQAHEPDVEMSSSRELVVDVLTDVRCPFSFLSLLNLQKAVKSMSLEDRVLFRYHPVFLNPNVSEEGESLDDYLLREYGYSKEFAHSENYPLRLQGLALGVELNPNRRVLNTLAASCLLELAEEVGKQHEALMALSRHYFEGAADISKLDVLTSIAKELDMDSDYVRQRLMEPSLREHVMARYEMFAQMVGEVPLFVVREKASGSGVELTGNHNPETWVEVLHSVQEKGKFMGMSVPGPEGKTVWLPEASPFGPVSMALSSQHGWAPSEWPYAEDDFSRADESADTVMYEEPRFVQHLDELSLSRLTGVYRSFFLAAKPGFAVLDLCSSWVSHFPAELMDGARVAVHGLNPRELAANPQATETHVQDLNADPSLPWEAGSFDFVTIALSVQYLTNPRAVFAEMNRVLKPGGVAIVAFSHRAFIEKAVRVWAEEPYDGEGHAHLICRYFQHSPHGGWDGLATIDVSPRIGDPMWLVTARKA